MWLIDKLAEARIKEAIGQGEFENLPGAGQPLRLEDDSHVPQELRAAYRLLKNAGYIPPELQLRQEIGQVQTLLHLAHDAESRQELSKRLNYLLSKLQHSGERHDLRVDSDYFARLCRRFNEI